MLSIQKSASDRTGLGYDFHSSNIASTSTTVFVPPSNNVDIKNNEIKTELASENLDNGKSILGANLSLRRKMLKTLELKMLTLKSLNRRSSISVIIVELLVILNQIAISVSHSTKQWHDSIWKPESALILPCSFWRSFQSSHVPFEIEQFQLFPFTTSSKV